MRFCASHREQIILIGRLLVDIVGQLENYLLNVQRWWTLPCRRPLSLSQTLISRTAAPAPERGRSLSGRARTACGRRGGGGGSL